MGVYVGKVEGMKKLRDWLVDLMIGKKQLAKIQDACNDFTEGKITDAEFMRVVWSDYPY